MDKKKEKKEKNEKKEEIAVTSLPQNVMLVGERVESDKNIYISQSVYKEIQKFTKDKLKNESGGVLIGEVVEAIGKINIIIEGFIEAKHSEGTPTTLKFTHETWEYIHKEMDKNYPEKKMMGWIHTHPSFGIFLSEYDIFIHQNYFNEDYEIAYVIDPIQHIEGFYYWLNGKIERCPGFYIYDKVGKKISVEQDEVSTNDSKNQSNWLKYAVIILLIIVAALGVFVIMLNSQVTEIEHNFNETAKKLNNNEFVLAQEYENVNTEIQNIKNEVEQIKADISNNNGKVDEITGGISQELLDIQTRIDSVENEIIEINEREQAREIEATLSELFEDRMSVFE